MYSKIVLAHDGSDGAARALPHAVALAKESGGKLAVVHVDERIAAKGDMPSIRADEDEIKEELRARVQQLAEEGVEAELVETAITLGGPGSAIADVAEQFDADVIVVGTRGRSSIPGLLLGSVAHRLLHTAHRPVLAIPPES